LIENVQTKLMNKARRIGGYGSAPQVWIVQNLLRALK
jgi:hypothetical protein